VSALSTADAEHRATTHRRIVRAAERCFLEFGPARTTMVDVAREAGVSRPTVYRYFRDRDAVVLEVLTRRVRAALGHAGRLLQDGAGLERSLQDVIPLLVARGRNDPMMRALVLEDDQDGSDLELFSVALELSSEFWEPVLVAAQRRRELREDLDVDEVCAWLAEMLMFLVSRTERAGALDSEVMVRKFVVPALVASPSSA
jgi:AcrR family transcriptional regulator